jgi:ribosome biogenesis GTPase
MVYTGSVWRVAGNRFEVRTPEGVFACALAGKLRRVRGADLRPVAVGDLVEIEASGGEGRIERVLPRRNALVRGDVHDRRRRQVLVANADLVVVVQAAAQPEIDWHEADRALVMAVAGGIPAMLCVNKIDLVGGASEAPVPPDLSEGAGRYRAAGYPVVFTSASARRGIEELRERMAGCACVLLGPSGVGKSSLLNALVPGVDLKTGAVSAALGGGRHTTTWFERVELPGGGDVADAPGVEVFEPWGVTRAGLAGCFPELEGLAGGCKFKDCRHVNEPGCVVKAALGGAVSRERYDSYVRIFESLPPDRPGGAAFAAQRTPRRPSLGGGPGNGSRG